MAAPRKHIYKATSDGVLNHPFRFVTKGTVLTFDSPITAAWLEPHDPAKPKAEVELPLMSSMIIAGSNVQQVLHAPVEAHPGYVDSMNDLLAHEKRLDEAKAGENGQQQGTGNQDVL